MICCRMQIRAFGMRRKEKLILYFIIFLFVMIFLGSYFHLPHDDNNGSASLIGRAYAKIIGNRAGPIQAPKYRKPGMLNLFSYLFLYFIS